MAFFPDVSRGQEFTPNALLSNNVRHLINALNGFAGKPISATGGMIRIQVYNNSGSTISAGTAVNFSDSGSLCDNAVPAEPLTDPAKPWGVLVNQLESKGIGSCIICGPATVKVSGTGDYAAPTKSSPSTFTRGATGSPVIFASDGKAVILLGAIAQDVYEGPFALSYDAENKKLKVAAGYLNRNGEWKDVAATELSPSSGTICVCTSLGDDGKWTEAEVKISTPGQYAFPIGSCKVDGESVTFCAFRVPVAIFLVSDVCSTTN